MLTKIIKDKDLICLENHTYKILQIGKIKIWWRFVINIYGATLYIDLDTN